MNSQYYRDRGLLRIFLGYFKPHKKLFALDMLCALFVAMVDLAFPLVSRSSMNELLPKGEFTAFFAVMAVMAVMPYTPSADIVFRSACMPAPPEESEPAMVRQE